MHDPQQLGDAIEMLLKAGYSKVVAHTDTHSVTYTDYGTAIVTTEHTTITVRGDVHDVVQTVEAITELL